MKCPQIKQKKPIIIAGSLESANSSILTTRNLFKDFGGEKTRISWSLGGQAADFFISDVILQCHNFTSQHVKQRHDVIFCLIST